MPTAPPITGKLSTWQFLCPCRPKAEERKFRDHYLDSDIRQVLSITLTGMALLAIVTITDVPRFTEVSGLSLGAYLRIFILVIAALVFWTIRRWLSPLVVDIALASFMLLIAICIVAFYAYADISIARIGTVVTLIIIAANIAYPVYGLYLLPAILVMIIGNALILINSTDPEAINNRTVIIIIFVFAELFGLVTSAHWQRNRYLAFRALSEVKTLSGMIPICAGCKKIRDDSGYYQQLEKYISAHSNAQFSHGLCPDCIADLYPELGQSPEAGRTPPSES